MICHRLTQMILPGLWLVLTNENDIHPADMADVEAHTDPAK